MRVRAALAVAVAVLSAVQWCGADSVGAVPQGTAAAITDEPAATDDAKSAMPQVGSAVAATEGGVDNPTEQQQQQQQQLQQQHQEHPKQLRRRTVIVNGKPVSVPVHTFDDGHHHAETLFGTLTALVLVQVGLYRWRQWHRQSYMQVTLLGLWSMPGVFCM